MILFYGSESYKPYLISLALDVLRFLIELQIKLCRKSQKEELKLRAKEAIVIMYSHNRFAIYWEILFTIK